MLYNTHIINNISIQFIMFDVGIFLGACKAGLWPLFHSMADRSLFDEEHWSAYRNNTFPSQEIRLRIC